MFRPPDANTVDPRLTPSQVTALVPHAMRQLLLGNTLFLHEGCHLEALYVVRQGSVKLVQGDEDGREIVLRIVGPGGYFGREACFGQTPRMAAMTLGVTELLVLSRASYERYLAALSSDFSLTVSAK